MHELIVQLKTYLRGVWRYRWTMMAAIWFVCIAGWIFVYHMPDEYEASARVHVDTQSMLRPLLRGLAVETSVQQQVNLMTRTLLSRPNLEKVARMTDMDLKAKTPEKMDSLLEGLRHEIQIKGAGKVDLYTISYQNSDPQLAKRVVQSLLTIFVESSLGETRKDSDAAQSFLQNQVKDYESRLRAAEERLKEYKRTHVGLMPSDGKDYFERLQDATNRLQQIKVSLDEAKTRRDELKRQLDGEEPAFGIAQPQSQSASQYDSPLNGRIQRLEEKLDSLLLKYTPQHPDVLAIKRTIKDLKEQRKKELAAMPKGAGEQQSLNQNPVYQQMKIQLSNAQANIAALKVRYKAQQDQVEKLRRMLDTVPQVEEDLTQLNRDYSINKQNYEKLLARLESAKISQQADQQASDVKFKIIDPPRVPSVPSAPNRPLFMSIIFAGGILSGIALAVFMSQVKMTFDNRRSLADAIGLPVLGSVSVIWTAPMLFKRRLAKASFVLISLMLVGVYSALMALQLAGPGVLSHVKSLLGAIT